VRSTFSQDSIDEMFRVSLGSTEDLTTKAYATLFYDWQSSDYDSTAFPYEFERAGIDAGLELTRTLTLVGDYGMESDLNKTLSGGGLEEEFWSAGLRWEPNEQSSFEGRYGERSYGESYSFHASHRARLLEFTASYSEAPTVQTQRLSLSDIFPGQLPPDVPDYDLGIVNTLPYLAKDARAGVRAEGAKTSIGVHAFWYERNYGNVQSELPVFEEDRADESGVGGVFDVTRHLASNLSADFTFSYREYERPIVNLPIEQTYEDAEAVLRLTRTSGEKLSIGAETGYLTRSGSGNYDGWWLALRATWTP
jgi:hypothetical protein